MKAAERISHVDSKKMKTLIRFAQRGKIKKNSTKIHVFMGKMRGMEKNENGYGVKRSLKRDLLHYMSFTVRLS